jgi:UDP-N-acetylmuramoyl-L-alanyl-D-glutamate--2,6-diaminopimelate ligase
VRKVPFIIVEDARAAMATIAAWYFDHPARKLKMVGITGTNGKTSVAFMVSHLIRCADRKVGMIGTVRYEIGDRQIPASRTTPDAIQLHRLLHEMVRAGCDTCVMEVSSHAIDQKRVLGIPFRIMVFTNLTRDHLDYHQDLEAYFETKKLLLDGSVGTAASALRIVNADDAFGRRLTAQLHGRRVRTFGQELAFQPDLLASEMDLAAGYTRFRLMGAGREPVTCLAPLIGRHNVSNLLAAAGVVFELGVTPEAFKMGLSTMPAVPGRLEPVHCGQPFSVFIDYAHTEDALYHVLTTMRPLTRERLHCVFGCGGNRDLGKRSRMGIVAAQWADRTWITSDNPRKEDPEVIAKDIESGYQTIRHDGSRIIMDRREAIETALSAAKPGDVVLIAGKGHETYQEFADTVVPFDDRATATDMLISMGYESPEAVEERRAS